MSFQYVTLRPTLLYRGIYDQHPADVAVHLFQLPLVNGGTLTSLDDVADTLYSTLFTILQLL